MYQSQGGGMSLHGYSLHSSNAEVQVTFSCYSLWGTIWNQPPHYGHTENNNWRDKCSNRYLDNDACWMCTLQLFDLSFMTLAVLIYSENFHHCAVQQSCISKMIFKNFLQQD